MGGCCSTPVSDGADEASVVAKVLLILDNKSQFGKYSMRDAEARTFVNASMTKTLEACKEAHGLEHPVTNLATWALSRILRVQALGVSRVTKDDPVRLDFFDQQSKLLLAVDENFQKGIGFPPVKGEPFFEFDDVTWPGCRATKIAEELALCYRYMAQGMKKEASSLYLKAATLLQRTYHATDEADKATPEMKFQAKLDFAEVVQESSLKAEFAIKLLHETIVEFAEVVAKQIDDTPMVDVLSGKMIEDLKDQTKLYEKLSGKLASLLSEKKKWHGVELLKQKHVAFLEKQHGEHHKSIPPVLVVLCEALFQQEKWAEAEPIMRRARNIKYMPSMDVALGMSLMMQGSTAKLEEAEALLRGALAGVFDKSGPDHPTTLQFRKNLAKCLQKADKDAEAEELLRAMLQSCDKIYGPGHPNAAETVSALCGVLGQKLGKVDEAVALQQEWIKKWEEDGDRHGSALFQAFESAAIVFDSLGKHAMAEPIHLKVVKSVTRPPGQAKHPKYLEAIKLLAENLDKQGKETQADELRKEILVSTLRRASVSRSSIMPSKHEAPSLDKMPSVSEVAQEKI